MHAFALLHDERIATFSASVQPPAHTEGQWELNKTDKDDSEQHAVTKVAERVAVFTGAIVTERTALRMYREPSRWMYLYRGEESNVPERASGGPL